MILLLGIMAKPYIMPNSLNDINRSKAKQNKPIVRYLSQKMRYTFDINGIERQIPYSTNLILDKNNSEVTQLILTIHSSSYNPDYYLENTLILLKETPELLKKTLIISPAFYRKDKTTLDDIVTWSVSPFWGSSRGLYHGVKINLSAYDVLDDMLTHIMTSQYFPNLRSVVILGHSAGGQLVNRYAACNKIEDTVAIEKNIAMRYLVMAPSSYVYMDDKRPKIGSITAQFEYPLNAHKKYNHWGYGLKHLYGYHKRKHITANMIEMQYKYREVLYLVGEKDTRDMALDKSKSAILEGSNRLERLKLYYQHLKVHYGEDITDYQKMAVIKGVGHSSRALMSSDIGKDFILKQHE